MPYKGIDRFPLVVLATLTSLNVLDFVGPLCFLGVPVAPLRPGLRAAAMRSVAA